MNIIEKIIKHKIYSNIFVNYLKYQVMSKTKLLDSIIQRFAIKIKFLSKILKL